LIAGGAAGFVESSVCHPLDTIKTRMQLRRQQTTIEAVRARSSIHEPDTARALSSMSEPRLVLSREAAIGHAAAKNTTNSNISLRMGNLHEPGLRPSLAAAMDVGTAAVESPSKITTVSIKPVHHHTPLVAAPLGPLGTARRIIQREGFFSLYKGLTAVYTGIIPKMAIRFVSFEQYREGLQRFVGTPSASAGSYSPTVNFFAGLLSGLTEAVVIVTPAEGKYLI